MRGTDTLYGGENDDALHGGADNDSLTGDSGADTLTGETGTDTADYTTRSVPITASIGGGANDGASGENDDIAADVENLRGGSNDDVLTGDANANRLYGAAGNDTLTGNAGNDLLYGDAGNDTINALDGLSFIDGLYCGAGSRQHHDRYPRPQDRRLRVTRAAQAAMATLRDFAPQLAVRSRRGRARRGHSSGDRTRRASPTAPRPATASEQQWAPDGTLRWRLGMAGPGPPRKKSARATGFRNARHVRTSSYTSTSTGNHMRNVLRILIVGGALTAFVLAMAAATARRTRATSIRSCSGWPARSRTLRRSRASLQPDRPVRPPLRDQDQGQGGQGGDQLHARPGPGAPRCAARANPAVDRRPAGDLGAGPRGRQVGDLRRGRQHRHAGRGDLRVPRRPAQPLGLRDPADPRMGLAGRRRLLRERPRDRRQPQHSVVDRALPGRRLSGQGRDARAQRHRRRQLRQHPHRVRRGRQHVDQPPVHHLGGRHQQLEHLRHGPVLARRPAGADQR